MFYWRGKKFAEFGLGGSIRLADGFSFSGIALPLQAADKTAFILVCQPCVLLLATRKRVPCFKYIWLFSLSRFNLFVVYGFISFVFFTALSKCNKQKAAKRSWFFSILYLPYTLYNSFSCMLNCYRHQTSFSLMSSVRIVLTGRSILLYPNGVLLSYSKVEHSLNPATIAGFSVYKKRSRICDFALVLILLKTICLHS